MALGVFQKIIKNNLTEGNIDDNGNIGVKIDQTLTQDATGTLVYLEFEALGIPKIKTELSASYVDHNLIQNGFMGADDHMFLQTSANKYGSYFSRPGNGICHRVHLERFAIPGKILLGSDSHTPTCGGIGMIAIGVGGLDVALAMAGEPFYFKMPKIVNVILKGKLKSFVSAKDIILLLLKEFGVKGGVNKVFEFSGDGVRTLSVSERATITNMGAELGATTSIFPSDQNTFEFMKLQKREGQWVEIFADKNAVYDQSFEINLDKLEPMVAKPHSPDNVAKVKDVSGIKVDQIAVGGCTNSSIEDIAKVALILKDKTIHPNVSMAWNPGSRQVLLELEKRGLLKYLISAGVRILEAGCGPCIGMGYSPPTDGVSLRTYNRNFLGRCNTKTAKVYLVSPEVAAASAINGVITDPRELGIYLNLEEYNLEENYFINDNMIIPPSKNPEKVEIKKGPNIQSLPIKEPLEKNIKTKIQLKVGDNITTDDIIPAGSDILPFRSNLPKISEYTFRNIDKTFVNRMKKEKSGIIIGGYNYGQGSSREHAALNIMYLGIKIVIAKSFARIHRSNLINFGILPLIFKNEEDYNKCNLGDILALNVDILKESDFKIYNTTKNISFEVFDDLNKREKIIVDAGGILPFHRNKK
jgi:aconitate hydratase